MSTADMTSEDTHSLTSSSTYGAKTPEHLTKSLPTDEKGTDEEWGGSAEVPAEVQPPEEEVEAPLPEPSPKQEESPKQEAVQLPKEPPQETPQAPPEEAALQETLPLSQEPLVVDTSLLSPDDTVGTPYGCRRST